MEETMNHKPTREWIIKEMRKGIVEFSFEKKDGELREMRATLVNQVMPEDKIPQTDYNAIAKSHPDVIRCFDVEIKEWRSFNISKLKSYDGIKKLL